MTGRISCRAHWLLAAAYQRRVVVITVLDRNEAVNVDESLRAAMAAEAERAPIPDSLQTNDSPGAGRAFTWAP
jgi:hypothetical protein